VDEGVSGAMLLTIPANSLCQSSSEIDLNHGDLMKEYT
jgi:hypothetical protein